MACESDRVCGVGGYADAIAVNSEKLTHDAFENELVLENIFKYCSIADLVDVRLVCRLWFKVCRSEWLRRGPPTKLIIQKVKESRNCDRERMDLSDFLRNINHTFTTYEYQRFNMDIRSGVHEGLVGFWTLLGSRVTSLEVKITEKFEAAGVEKLTESIISCRHTPNLVKLCMDIQVNLKGQMHTQPWWNGEIGSLRKIKLVGSTGEMAVDWFIILKRFPYLEDIQFDKLLYSKASILFAAIRDIRIQDPSKLQLKSFNWFDTEAAFTQYQIHSPTSRMLFELLRDTGLHPYDLGIHITNEDSAEILENLFRTNAASLGSLSLYCSVPFLTSPFFGCYLTQLQKFTFSGFAFRNASFLKDLPSLQSLEYKRMDHIFLPTSHPNLKPNDFIRNSKCIQGLIFPSVTRLIWGQVLELPELMVVVNWFPNVSTIKIELDDEGVKLVCKNLTKLQNFTLLCRETNVTDAGIMALPAAQSIRSFKITQLNATTITAEGVFKGFLKLPRLMVLSISAVYMMRPDVQSLIQHHIPFVQIKKCAPQCFEKPIYYFGIR